MVDFRNLTTITREFNAHFFVWLRELTIVLLNIRHRKSLALRGWYIHVSFPALLC